MRLNIHDETSILKTVILGRADTLGDKPKLNQTYDPSSLLNLKKGTYPLKSDLVKELDTYKITLKKNRIKVIELDEILNCNQIYARDIGFVIQEFFFISNIIPLRGREINGLNSILSEIDNSKIIKLPEEVHIEGGDVILDNDNIFLGHYNKPDYKKQKTARTNINGVKYLENFFGKEKIKSFELNKSMFNPKKNALHLDCCFQPVGKKLAVICKDGFKNLNDYEWLIDYYGIENILNLNSSEMSLMMCNFFSISPEKVITDVRFKKLNYWLNSKNIKTIEINLSQTSKQGGLFRCTTLPLFRKNDIN